MPPIAADATAGKNHDASQNDIYANQSYTQNTLVSSHNVRVTSSTSSYIIACPSTEQVSRTDKSSVHLSKRSAKYKFQSRSHVMPGMPTVKLERLQIGKSTALVVGLLTVVAGL